MLQLFLVCFLGSDYLTILTQRCKWENPLSVFALNKKLTLIAQTNALNHTDSSLAELWQKKMINQIFRRRLEILLGKQRLDAIKTS